ncbi:MAG: hypothetical protein IKD42_01795 [Kiritimatiellae bacterium]|nr:hypothetical protein [Kiritimatiellia bacterium]
MFFLAASLWFASPSPLDMPRAETYLVSGADGMSCLEDRYDETDLWTYRTVSGRWTDADGRLFVLARLAAKPPVFAGEAKTRAGYRALERPIDPGKDLAAVRAAVARLSPVEPAEKFTRPHIPVRGMKDVLFWEGTNTSAVVCTFIEEGSSVWRAAIWTLVEGDDREEARARMLDELLPNWGKTAEKELPGEARERIEDARRRTGKPPRAVSERELLRADAERGVANYPSWHVSSSGDLVVLDNLPRTSGFVAALTNDLPRMMGKYAAAVPAAVAASNALAVARIYSSRSEYLAAAGDDMRWSAAYWSPARRELVAYLPPGGEKELLKTMRHEAFHRYLSYAVAFIPVSPWFNEGYAQFFEDEDDLGWKTPPFAGGEPSPEEIDELAGILPALMFMDYDEFYAGSDVERRMKYRLAWSVAVFIELGAPHVKDRPWENLKQDYLKGIVQTRDMRKATAMVLGEEGKMDRFVEDWKNFWR